MVTTNKFGLSSVRLDNLSISQAGDWFRHNYLDYGVTVTKYGALVAAVLLLATIRVIYLLYLHPLSGFPGPFLAKIMGAWRNRKYYQGQWHQDVLDLHKKYGRVVRIAPNEVSVVDEFAMKNLYGHGHNATKTRWYDIWNPPGGTALFSEVNKKPHAFLRKRVAQAYSMSSILKYKKYIQSCLDMMLYRLKHHADAGHTVDMATWTNALAFDVVGELAYGEQLGHLHTENDVRNLRKTIFNAFFMLSNLGHMPFAATLITSKFASRVLPNPFGGFLAWSTQKVQDRMANPEKRLRDDMLSHFCRMKDTMGYPASVDDVLIEAMNEAMNLVCAGADTTSIGMKACLYHLAQDRRVYKLVQDEVDEFYTANNLAEPISYLQTQQLPWLEAVVKEATRLHPSIVFQLLRHASPGFTVRGQHIPAGTPVGISPMAQNRDRDIWGENADEFLPERWLENDARTIYPDSSSMKFGGSGPRMCVGRNIALVEIRRFVAQFIHNFDFEIANKTTPWRVITYWFATQRDSQMNIHFATNARCDSQKGSTSLGMISHKNERACDTMEGQERSMESDERWALLAACA